MRKSEVLRRTAETNIKLSLVLDGSGEYDVKTGCGFLDHMLELFTRHGSFDLTLRCSGDTHVDYHHTAEDVAIALGQAFCEALGSKAGINRYGSVMLPMDETLVLAAVDISGRAALGFTLDIPSNRVGDFDTELVEEFMAAFSRSLGAAVHLQKLSGKNSHHITEAAFKALARAMREAVAIDPGAKGRVPSTKGLL